MTRREQSELRAHFHTLRLRFAKDGTIYGQQRPGGAYGVLYTPKQAADHVAFVRAHKSRPAGGAK
jgi:hypothetical protein